METKHYTAVKHISNVGGVGITAIDHTDDMIEYDVVWGDKVAYSGVAPIEYRDDTTGFIMGGEFQDLNEFMRVG